MRQYELAIRIAQVHHLVDERKYKKALAVIQTLDVKQVRSISDLKVFAEVYTKTEQYDAAKAMYLKICQSSKTRRVLHRLIYLSIRTNSLGDAEEYYEEYLQMNPTTRDALILRYRIDKAAGVPIGNLIEILQELKQEEYIEEWAYELAKLYHRAGRREECMEECKDIMLWFGSGEIVERAKILMDHLQEKDPIPYYDDKDFTIPKKEEPNPYDTGSLPDLNEFIKERKALKREEKKARKAEPDYEENYNEEIAYSREKEESMKKPKEQPASDTDFIDDYEEDDFEKDMLFPHVAKGGIHKLSGLLRFGRKEEDKTDRKEPEEQKKEEAEWEEKVQKKDTPEQEITLADQREEIPEQKEKIPEYETKRVRGSEKKKEPSEVAKERLLQEKEALEKERERLLREKEEAEKEKERLRKEKEEADKEKERLRQEKETSDKEKLPQKEEQKQEGQTSVVTQETIRIEKEQPKKKKAEYVPHSQSGTGITQDLAKEISAIYEMEQKGQLKEKSIAVIEEKERAEEKKQVVVKQRVPEKERISEKQRVPQKGRVPEKQRMPEKQRVPEKGRVLEKEQGTVTKPIKRVRAAREPKDKTNIATNLVDRMTQAIQNSTSKSYIPIGVGEGWKSTERRAPVGGAAKSPKVQDRKEPGRPSKVQEKQKVGKDLENVIIRKKPEEHLAAKVQEKYVEEKTETEEEILKNLLEEEIEDPERLQEPIVYEENVGLEDELEKADEFSEIVETQKELAETSEELEEVDELSEELEDIIEPAEETRGEEEATEPAEEEREEEEAIEPAGEEREEEEAIELAEEEGGEEETTEPAEEEGEVEEAIEPTEEEREEEEAAEPAEEEGEVEEVTEPDYEEEGETEEVIEPEEEGMIDEEISDDRETTKDLTETIQAVKRGSSTLQNYHAPEIPRVETDYTGMPQITYEDLPTTRALQQSFKDVLRLIEGELDPSHFVLMGDGTERVIGVSKKIVHVMKESGYLSVGRIAKICASQLNKMDLISFRKQLRGNCLLIEEASDLLFPTITKIFSIMEEYAGDFVVILSDEGTTLDQLFRFVPVLAKRFKYIIDITKYTEKDYQ